MTLPAQRHQTPEMVAWCVVRGIVPLYPPLGGSWLNLTEAVQRILVRRAVAGQHPESAQEVMAWLAAEVRGWNEAPTPFHWGGKRAARRQRANAVFARCPDPPSHPTCKKEEGVPG